MKMVDKRIQLERLIEYGSREAVITTKVDSIKNPQSGQIQVPELGELIMDDIDAKGQVLVIGEEKQDSSIRRCNCA